MNFNDHQITDNEVTFLMGKVSAIADSFNLISENPNYIIPEEVKGDFEDLKIITGTTNDSQVEVETSESTLSLPANPEDENNQDFEKSEPDEVLEYYAWKSIKVLKAILDANSGETNNLRTDLVKWNKDKADILLLFVDDYEDNKETIDEAIRKYEFQTELERKAIEDANLTAYKRGKGLVTEYELEEISKSKGIPAIQQILDQYEKELKTRLDNFFDLLNSFYFNPDLLKIDTYDAHIRIQGLEKLRAMSYDQLDNPSAIGGRLLNLMKTSSDLNLSENQIQSLKAIFEDIDERIQPNYVTVKKFLSK